MSSPPPFGRCSRLEPPRSHAAHFQHTGSRFEPPPPSWCWRHGGRRQARPSGQRALLQAAGRQPELERCGDQEGPPQGRPAAPSRQGCVQRAGRGPPAPPSGMASGHVAAAASLPPPSFRPLNLCASPPFSLLSSSGGDEKVKLKNVDDYQYGLFQK